ncbi:MAG: hypothetical protein VW338_03445 [Rhodospirillaceae bacterium]
MSALDRSESGIGGVFGREIERLWEALRQVQPVSGPLLDYDQTNLGVNWRPTEELLGRIGGSGMATRLAEITAVAPLTLTAVDGEATYTVQRPAALQSFSATRDDSSDLRNWRPSHGAFGVPSYNYGDAQHRHKIIHEAMRVNQGQTIDYAVVLQKLDPLYQAGDRLLIGQAAGQWWDLNIDGRHWRDLAQWNSEQSTASGQLVTNLNRLWFRGTAQTSAQTYGNDTVTWISLTDFSALAKF